MDTVTLLRAQLRSRRGGWPGICKTTGLGYDWLTKFAQGRIAEPGLSKIEKLQRYFAAHPTDEANEPHRSAAAPKGSEAADPAPAVQVDEAA